MRIASMPLSDGGLEATHTGNVLGAYGSYAEWVDALAAEFSLSEVQTL